VTRVKRVFALVIVAATASCAAMWGFDERTLRWCSESPEAAGADFCDDFDSPGPIPEPAKGWLVLGAIANTESAASPPRALRIRASTSGAGALSRALEVPPGHDLACVRVHLDIGDVEGLPSSGGALVIVGVLFPKPGDLSTSIGIGLHSDGPPVIVHATADGGSATPLGGIGSRPSSWLGVELRLRRSSSTLEVRLASGTAGATTIPVDLTGGAPQLELGVTTATLKAFGPATALSATIDYDDVTIAYDENCAK
jgi:hypothetical protein